MLDDPSGNSFVENPHAPQKDEALVVSHYRRTAQQAAMLGIQVTRLWGLLASGVLGFHPRTQTLSFCPWWGRFPLAWAVSFLLDPAAVGVVSCPEWPLHRPVFSFRRRSPLTMWLSLLMSSGMR